jgi:hypothetical protein
VLAVVLLSGCSSPGLQKAHQAQLLAQTAGLVAMPVQTALPIQVYGRLDDSKKPVHIYIEGDGRAWRNARQPSLDPTPHNPVALKLAAVDASPNVLYVGRPCQYLNDPAKGCRFKTWTEQRFAYADQLQQAIEQSSGTGRSSVLIGFSGGANLVVQLAERMSATQGLITLAGNLDSVAFADFHDLPKEDFGHNGARLRRLAKLPQLHYTGGKDTVIPPSLTRQMLAGQTSGGCVAIRVEPQASHAGPWVIDWEEFAVLQSRCGTQGSLRAQKRAH